MHACIFRTPKHESDAQTVGHVNASPPKHRHEAPRPHCMQMRLAGHEQHAGEGHKLGVRLFLVATNHTPAETVMRIPLNFIGVGVGSVGHI